MKKDFFGLTVQGQSITVDKHGGGIMGHLVTWPWPSGNRGFWLELGFNYDPIIPAIIALSLSVGPYEDLATSPNSAPK